MPRQYSRDFIQSFAAPCAMEEIKFANRQNSTNDALESLFALKIGQAVQVDCDHDDSDESRKLRARVSRVVTLANKQLEATNEKTRRFAVRRTVDGWAIICRNNEDTPLVKTVKLPAGKRRVKKV